MHCISFRTGPAHFEINVRYFDFLRVSARSAWCPKNKDAAEECFEKQVGDSVYFSWVRAGASELEFPEFEHPPATRPVTTIRTIRAVLFCFI